MAIVPLVGAAFIKKLRTGKIVKKVPHVFFKIGVRGPKQNGYQVALAKFSKIS
jgi:hypothetical protein